jgi:peptidoglycan/LPS O-acetylase OafA/YrhL
MLCAGMTMFIAGASQCRGAIDRFLSLPALLVLGEASYALYLIQRPTDEWLRFVWKHPTSMNNFNATVIVTSILASLAIWAWFERPIGKALSKYFVRA